MTYYNLKNRNERLMLSYIDFLPYCESIEAKMKLLDHIWELRTKNLSITRMTVEEAHQQVELYKDSKASKINTAEAPF